MAPRGVRVHRPQRLQPAPGLHQGGRLAPAVGRHLTSLGLGALLVIACARQPLPAPAEVASGLYRALIDSQVTGAPTPSQLAALRPWLGAELQRLLDSARTLSDAEAAAHPGEKPPFVEGDLFSSLFEGPEALPELTEVPGEGDRRLLARFTDSRATPPVTWTDTVIVREESGRLVVADVRYGGTWDFASRGSLVASLRTGLQPLPGEATLRFDGIGAVRVGMPIGEVERLLGATARIERIEPGDECGYAYLSSLPSIALMLAADTVVRVDVSGAGILSEAGVGVGTPEAEVLARYRGMIRVEPHPYTGPDGHYLIVDDPARPGLRMIFETDGRTVTDLRAGRLPEADLIEGCA